MEWLVAWGVSNLAGFVFTEVLAPLAKGTLEDYTKDFFKGCISDLTKIANREPLKKSVGQALKEFLLLVQDELQAWGLSKAEIRDKYNRAIKQFIYNDTVKPVLGKAFEPGCKSIDAETLEATWTQLKLPALPEEFDWNQIAKQYLRRVKALVRESEELRAILDSENLEAMRGSMEALIGIIPDFDLQRYRESLQEFYGYLKLETLDPSSYQYPVRLWQVFVPQTVREAMPLVDIPKDHLRRLLAANQLDAEFSPEELERYREVYYQQPLRSVLEILNEPSCQYVVILGDPGSGKSTLAQYVALDWAEKPTKTIPLLIELRKYTRDRTSPKSFLEFIHQGAAAIYHLNQNRLDERLVSGEAFVIFDGLDEVFDPIVRDTVITEIIRFTNQYPKVRVMVMSRIIGYKAQRLRDAQFRHFTLQDFEPEQVREFVIKWHDLAFGDRPEKIRLQERLQRAIDESLAIRELAGNPLLLTMMAILNRSQELPRDRAELYEKASGVLLHEWDIEKGLPPDEKLAPDTITRKEKQAMLRQVAYHMQGAPEGLAGNLISADDLEKVLTGYLETLQEVEKTRTVALLIIKQLRERNFILCFSGADCYAFVHRTFLEFFCAWEFVWQFKEKQILSIENLKAEVFGKHWQDESWHEVLRLIAGMIDERFIGEVIDYLMEQDGEIAEFSNLFLATRCLSEVKSYFQIQTTADQLLNQLKKLTKYKRRYEPNKYIDNERLVRKIRTQAVSALATTWNTHSDTLPWLKTCAEFDDDPVLRQTAVQELARGWKDHPDTLPWLKTRAQSNNFYAVRQTAVQELARGWKDHPDTLPWLKTRAQADNSYAVQQTAVQELARGWKYHPDTLPWLKTHAQSNDNDDVRVAAVQELARGWKDHSDTLAILKTCAQSDNYYAVRKVGLQQVAYGWKDHPDTLPILKTCAQSDDNWMVRQMAVQELARGWKDHPDILPWLKTRAQSDDHWMVRQALVQELARGWKDHPDTLPWLKTRAQLDEYPTVRQAALRKLARGWKDDPDTLPILKSCAQSDKHEYVRQAAVYELAIGWKDDPDTLPIIKTRVQSDDHWTVRQAAVQELVFRWKDDPDTLPILKTCAQSDDHSAVRWNAVHELACGWKDEPWLFKFLCYCAVKDPFERKDDREPNPRQTALRIIVERYPHNAQTRQLLQNRAARDPDKKVREFASQQLKKLI